MFEKFSRSWALVKASGAVLMQDQKLLIFPLLSTIASLAVAACFILPMLGLNAFDGLSGGRNVSNGMYVAAFLFYLSQYFVIFFFNAALMGAAMIRMDGGTPSVSDGLKLAASKAVPILGYAFIAATVGMILRAIQERVGFIGSIIVGFIGLGWTMATYLVVPVLVANNVGPIEAVKESANLFKKTWGESAIGQAGIGFALGFVNIAMFIVAAILIAAAVYSGSMVLIVPVVLLVVAGFMIAALVHSALSQIYAAALYRYATTGEGTTGFDNSALQQAFLPKK